MPTKAIWACALGAAAVWAMIALRGTGVDRSRAAVAATEVAANPTEAERMQGELERVQANLARAERRLSDLETQPSPSAVTPSVDGALEPESSPKTPELSETERRALVTQSFERELRDPAWRPEEEIRTLLRAVLPAGASVRALDCRQTLCRLETTHPDQASHAALVQALAMPAPDQPHPFGGALFDEGEPAEGGRGLRSTTYLLRIGHDMPAPTAVAEAQ